MKRLLARITAAFAGTMADGARFDLTRTDADGPAAFPPAGAEEKNGPASPFAAGMQGEEGPFGLLLRTRLRLPRRLDLAFDRHLAGDGWHNPETAGNLPFRWMGLAESATVWLAIDRSVALTFDLAIYLFIDPAWADRTGVAVGEPPEPVAHEHTAEGLSFVLPPAPHHVGPTRITLRAPGLVPGSDPRCLSIACSCLRVRPLDAGIVDDGSLTLRTALSRHLPARDVAVGEGFEVQHLE